MRTVKLSKAPKLTREVELNGGHSIKIWENFRELPMNRFTSTQKYFIQQVGIGSTLEDVNTHMERLHLFLAAEKIEEARQEAMNMHYALHLAINKINVKHICFTSLVYAVDDKPVEDHSENALVELCIQLGEWGLTDAMVNDILSDVKKKSIGI